MRAPGTGSPDWKGPKHFLTDWYTNLLQLECIPLSTTVRKGSTASMDSLNSAGKVRSDIDKNFLITTSFYYKQWSSLD